MVKISEIEKVHRKEELVMPKKRLYLLSAYKKAVFLLFGVIVLYRCSSFIQSKQTVNQPIPREQFSSPQNNGISNDPAVIPIIDHIVVVIEENHSYEQIIGNPAAPYINRLVKQGANFTDYHAIEHPSQPNYLDIFSGSNQGVTNDSLPAYRFSTGNLARELIHRLLTFGGYSEDLPSVGYNGVTNLEKTYARKHNPWVNFSNIPKEVNMPLTMFPEDYSQLPTISFVIPNLNHDMHDGTIEEADQWLYDHLDSYVQWAKQHNSLLVVTWDEDDGSQGNQIPTIFVGPMIRVGEYNEKVNHFNLLRTFEDAYDLSHAGHSQYSYPLLNMWKNDRE
jgi:phosphatidylinositol-3-phosphatase